MRKMLKYLLIFFIQIGFFSNQIFSQSQVQDEKKTIKELKQNIEKLSKQREGILIKIKNISGSEALKNFFVEKLEIQDIYKIKKIIDKYNLEKKSLDQLLIKQDNGDNLKQFKIGMLEAKKHLYKGLYPYIKKQKYKEYLDFIREDSKNYIKNENIEKNINKKKAIIDNKVEILEEKIKQHKSKFKDNLNNLIKERIDKKLEELSKNPSFSNLSKNKKISILDKSIEKLNILIQKTKKSINNNKDEKNFIQLQQKKLTIYKAMVERFIKFREKFF